MKLVITSGLSHKMQIKNKVLLFIFRQAWVLFIPVFIVSTSFNPDERKIIDISDAAPGNFSWLKDFYTMSQCVSIEHFDKTPGKSYDSAGVSMTNGKYHPVNVFQYGIFCFDKYRQTGDEQFKKKCIAQFKYFLDSANYHIKPDGSIAFPYLIGWRDLKPPWYSGLAQIQGIMYLIRYYSLTKDERALYFIKRTYNFMMRPIAENGTFNLISDSEVWIEEYPNSKSKPEVLNGFATAIMGMREYCYMFPKDIQAKEILEKCISTHKKWVHKYDYGSGILYDLGERQQVGPWYMKIQVIQMKQMYDLYNDIFYHDLEMLWATYSYNKPVTGMFGCLLTDTNYSVPAQLNGSGEYIPSNYIAYSLKPDKVLKLSSETMRDIKNYTNLFDGNKATPLSFKADTINKNVLSLYIRLKKSIDTENIFITGTNDSLPALNIELFHRKDSVSKWKPFKIKNAFYEDKTMTFSVKSVEFAELKITFNNLTGKKSITIAEINMFSNSNLKMPCYSHFETQEFSLSENKTSFQLKNSNINDFVIFYKSANTAQDLLKATWKIYDGIRKSNFDLVCDDKRCKFLVVFKNSFGSKVQLVKN